MKKTLVWVFMITICLVSCTAETYNLTQCVSTNEKGFWYGLWHGIISPITFIVSLFSDSVGIYEANNNGGWYNFGFMLGCAIILGGGSETTKKR